jgi:hypothetical protein
MELVEQRIKLSSTISEHVCRRVILARWQTNRINDVLPLGSISNVHGIMSNGHHMYDVAVNRIDVCCLCQQTNVRRDDSELCE